MKTALEILKTMGRAGVKLIIWLGKTLEGGK